MIATGAAAAAAVVALATGLTLAAGGIVAWWRERTALISVLRAVVPTGRIRDRDDLVRLKHRLGASIRWDPARAHDPRPLLRASAARVLATGEGFCGENARVAVRLLRLGGVDAHRLYLDGARWGHVVVEHKWEGRWTMFDGHVDPRTALPDELVGRIAADDLAAYPNRAAENPWRRSFRLPGSAGRGAAARLRPPALVTALAESPALVVAAGGAALAILGGAALLAL